MRGVADRYGSLEAGKVANVVVWSGARWNCSSSGARDHPRARGADGLTPDGAARPLPDDRPDLRVQALKKQPSSRGAAEEGWLLSAAPLGSRPISSTKVSRGHTGSSMSGSAAPKLLQFCRLAFCPSAAFAMRHRPICQLPISGGNMKRTNTGPPGPA